jgi:Domain of unknown function (DUF2017)
MSAFSRAPGGRRRDPGDSSEYIARFTADESAVIRDLVRQVAELVSGTAGGEAPTGQGRDDAPDSTDSAEDPLEVPADGDEPGIDDDLGITDRPPPDDPVLARLLPDAYQEDPDSAGEFRRYTEQDLRDGKTAAALTVLDTLPESGGRVTLSEDQAQTWLRALNDVRLALGVRLEVTEQVYDELAKMDPADPRYGALAIYDWLTAVQESLVLALS